MSLTVTPREDMTNPQVPKYQGMRVTPLKGLQKRIEWNESLLQAEGYVYPACY